jgi:hypothetical protein
VGRPFTGDIKGTKEKEASAPEAPNSEMRGRKKSTGKRHFLLPYDE